MKITATFVETFKDQFARSGSRHSPSVERLWPGRPYDSTHRFPHTIMPTIASILLSCLLGWVPFAATPADRRCLPGITDAFQDRTSAMAEVASIWAAYGVDVRASSENDEGRDGAVRLAGRRGKGPSRDREEVLGGVD